MQFLHTHKLIKAGATVNDTIITRHGVLIEVQKKVVAEDATITVNLIHAYRMNGAELCCSKRDENDRHQYINNPRIQCDFGLIAEGFDYLETHERIQRINDVDMETITLRFRRGLQELYFPVFASHFNLYVRDDNRSWADLLEQYSWRTGYGVVEIDEHGKIIKPVS